MADIIVERAEKESTKEKKSIVVNQVVLRSIDRTAKDIQSFKNALQAAEYVIHPNRVLLYDLYSTIELDGHLTGLWKKRIAQARNKKIHYEVNGKKIDAMDALIGSPLFRELVLKILETQSHGLSGIEFIPGKDFYFKEIPRKHINTHLRRIVYEQSMEEGISYDGVWNLWIMEGEDDFGFLLKCAPYAIWKKGDFADWAQYVEIFGQPVIVMKYDANDEKTKFELQQVIDEAGSSLRLLIPEQAKFEMIDGKQSNGNGELQEKLKNACNDEMSVVILGNTETTSNTNGGSNAKAQEHGKQQDEIMKDDIVMLLNYLNSPFFANVLKSYGYPVADGGVFVTEKQVDLTELGKRLTIDKGVAEKVPIDDDYWYETYAIPKPANYEAMRKAMDAENQAKLNPAPPSPPGAGRAEAKQKKKPVAKTKELSLLDNIRKQLSDFFDPGPND